MPVLYKEVGTDGAPWKETEANGMLVQLAEPDFSMPFNMLSVTNAMLGVFFIKCEIHEQGETDNKQQTGAIGHFVCSH